MIRKTVLSILAALVFSVPAYAYEYDAGIYPSVGEWWMDYSVADANRDNGGEFNLSRGYVSLKTDRVTQTGVLYSLNATMDLAEENVLKYGNIVATEGNATVTAGMFRTTFGNAAVWNYATPEPSLSEQLGITSEAVEGVSVKFVGRSATLDLSYTSSLLPGENDATATLWNSGAENWGGLPTIGAALRALGNDGDYAIAGVLSPTSVFRTKISGEILLTNRDDHSETGFSGTCTLTEVPFYPVVTVSSFDGETNTTAGLRFYFSSRLNLGAYLILPSEGTNSGLARLSWEL